jgi:hypothetical protein
MRLESFGQLASHLTSRQVSWIEAFIIDYSSATIETRERTIVIVRVLVRDELGGVGSSVSEDGLGPLPTSLSTEGVPAATISNLSFQGSHIAQPRARGEASKIRT